MRRYKAVSNLRTNKDNKGNRIISIYSKKHLQKQEERDLNAINLLAKDANPAQLEKCTIFICNSTSVKKK
jgi:hypothetical protein